jgi:hypothetical protein
MLIPNLWYTSNSRLAGLILDKSPNIQKHKLHLYGIPINPIISNIYIYPSTCLETVSTNHSKPTIDPIDLSACESYPQVVLLRPTFWWGETTCFPCPNEVFVGGFPSTNKSCWNPVCQIPMGHGQILCSAFHVTDPEFSCVGTDGCALPGSPPKSWLQVI